MQNQHKKKIKGKLKYHFQSLKNKKQNKSSIFFFFLQKAPPFLPLLGINESKMHDYKTTWNQLN